MIADQFKYPDLIFFFFFLFFQETKRLRESVPENTVATMQEELAAAKLREAEANLALKELRSKVSGEAKATRLSNIGCKECVWGEFCITQQLNRLNVYLYFRKCEKLGTKCVRQSLNIQASKTTNSKDIFFATYFNSIDLCSTTACKKE